MDTVSDEIVDAMNASAVLRRIEGAAQYGPEILMFHSTFVDTLRSEGTIISIHRIKVDSVYRVADTSRVPQLDSQSRRRRSQNGQNIKNWFKSVPSAPRNQKFRSSPPPPRTQMLVTPLHRI